MTSLPFRQTGSRRTGDTISRDRPLFGDIMFDGEEGPFSAISVDVPDAELAEYEDTEFHHHHADHREWIQVPGELLNRYKHTFQVHQDPGAGPQGK